MSGSERGGEKPTAEMAARRSPPTPHFKVMMPSAANPSQGRARRRDFRERVLAAFTAAEFHPIGPVRKASRFFSADFAYPNTFDPSNGFRPYLQIEMTFDAPSLPPVDRPIRSLVARAQDRAPEIQAFPCVDPVETAADKLSALAWRVCARERGSPKDDPTIVRHLHDLAALESRVAIAPAFTTLLLAAAAADSGRGGGRAPLGVPGRFSMMLDRLRTDPLWAEEYDRFVQNVSFATSDQVVPFDKALEAARRLATASGVIARSA